MEGRIIFLLNGVSMDSLWIGIMKSIGQLPVVVQIFILLVFSITQILAVVGIKNIIPIFKIWVNRKAGKDKINISKPAVKKTQSDLLNHPLFFTSSHVINHKVNMMNFGDDNRNKIFRTLMEIKIKSICHQSKTIISDSNLKTMSKLDFKALVFSSFSNTLDEYNTEIKERFSDDIYGLVMQHSTKGFNAWNEPVVVYTKNLIEDICDSDLYRDNIDKSCAILTAYHSAIDATIVNIEKTFHGFNGELDDMIKNRKL